MQKLLTIVVPVYKVEPYIKKCLDSLVLEDEGLMNQLEVVIVNDGTPDNSAEMSREYTKRYPQTFRQIDKENGGHGSAWNVGLKEATGRYLRFLDSDDWLTNLDRLMLDLKNCDADVVFNPFEVCLGNEVLVIPAPKRLVSLSGYGQVSAIVKDNWKLSESQYCNVNFWSATYKTKILRPLWPLFAEKVMYDDYILTWAPLIHGRTCVAFNYVLYNYLGGRPGSSMSVSQMQKRAVSYGVCFRQYETIRKRIIEEDLPRDLLERIDEAIEIYARYIFWYEVFLPYNGAKEMLQHLYDRYLKGCKSGAVLRRYINLSFFLFYWAEHLRYKKNKLFGNV